METCDTQLRMQVGKSVDHGGWVPFGSASTGFNWGMIGCLTNVLHKSMTPEIHSISVQQTVQMVYTKPH